MATTYLTSLGEEKILVSRIGSSIVSFAILASVDMADLLFANLSFSALSSASGGPIRTLIKFVKAITVSD